MSHKKWQYAYLKYEQANPGDPELAQSNLGDPELAETNSSDPELVVVYYTSPEGRGRHETKVPKDVDGSDAIFSEIDGLGKEGWEVFQVTHRIFDREVVDYPTLAVYHLRRQVDAPPETQ